MRATRAALGSCGRRRAYAQVSDGDTVPMKQPFWSEGVRLPNGRAERWLCLWGALPAYGGGRLGGEAKLTIEGSM
ncbi:hypothetical protein GCM10022384_60970 [Streptomyces marokkonensis]|uniref:Uncharacterized protein n=1 Tax=Streptomyces marokkonensis TaxID=324855 RepID=A0ABP7S4I2_9ACTN